MCQPSGRVERFLPLLVLSLLFLSHESTAIPAFSRMYGTSCSTCHIDFPKLNDFGKAFKDAGFKFPKDDEQMLKIPPVMLGAPANAEVVAQGDLAWHHSGPACHRAQIQQLLPVHRE